MTSYQLEFRHKTQEMKQWHIFTALKAKENHSFVCSLKSESQKSAEVFFTKFQVLKRKSELHWLNISI